MKNVNELKNFVSFFPNFKNCLIQTFDDQWKWEKNLARVIKVKEGWLNECLDLNKKGAWIYFSVNWMEGEKRNKENVNCLNSWIVESDILSKEKQIEKILNAPLPPSLIVESKKSFHIYYFCEDNKVDEKRLENWVKINNWLCDYYQWDEKIVKDTARVLRIPWFFHLKDRDNPFLIKADYLADINKEKPFYSDNEMLEKFPQKENKQINNEKDFRKPVYDVYGELQNLNCEFVLNKISQSELVDFETIEIKNNTNWTKQIFIDWKSTSSWIDKNWLIGSSDGGWPSWIDWVKWYWKKTEKEITKWWLDNLSDVLKLPQKTDKIDIKIPKKDFKRESFIFPGWGVFDNFGCLLSWELLTIVAESNSGKTTFAMDIMSANYDKKSLYLNLEFDIKTVWEGRRLYLNWKKKINLAEDREPLTDSEKYEMKKYIDNNLNKFDYINKPEWIELNELIKMIILKEKEWYKLFVIDTFSRIKGNLDNETARTSQNKAMEKLQELAQKRWVAIILLHHTNKRWVFEWSQKILDLSTMFILIKKESWAVGEYRKFSLIKDKYQSSVEIDVWFDKKQYQLLF